MKKLFLSLFLALVAFSASAGPNDLIVRQLDAAGIGEIPRLVVLPGGGLSGIVIYDSSTNLPKLATAGTGISISGGSVSATGPTLSQSSVTRTLNTIFQISPSRWSSAVYSVQCTITASIAGGQNCDVIFEIASDAAFTLNVQTVSICGDGQTYTLAIALQGVQPSTKACSGWVPAGYYSRLRTVQNTGSPSFSYRAGQETLF